MPRLLARHVPARDVLVVTNRPSARCTADRLCRGLAGKRVATVILPDGEQYKTLDVLERVFDALVEARCNREACVVALGGGVVGDMAGFAAACYQRGVDSCRCRPRCSRRWTPPSAARPASIIRGGKNLIGAFHQPRAVLADTDTLRTLPPRELRAGLAEVIKYGLVGDAGVSRVARGQPRQVARPATCDGAGAGDPPLLRDQGRHGRRGRTRARPAARCSISGTRSGTRSRPPRAMASGCTARRSRSAC